MESSQEKEDEMLPKCECGADRVPGRTITESSDRYVFDGASVLAVEFDRFIAKVKAETLREADSALGDLDNQWPDHLYPAVRGWLKARADRIEND